MYVVIAVLLGFVLVAPAQAQVQVDIGIHLPALPRLVVVPQVPGVQYVPAAPGNLFYYNDQYWVFANGLWHVSRGYNGPWIVVAPQFVPRPVLLVPVRYYPVRPGHWQRWVDHYPPRWHHDWGRDWAHKREWTHGARGRDDDDRRGGRGRDRGRGDDDDDDRGKGRGRGRSR